MVFLSVGIFLGCALRQHKKAGSIAVSVLLVCYFASMIMGMSEKLLFLRYFTPFKYFNAVLMMRESRLELRFVLLSLAISAIAMLAAQFVFAKRDLAI